MNDIDFGEDLAEMQNLLGDEKKEKKSESGEKNENS